MSNSIQAVEIGSIVQFSPNMGRLAHRLGVIRAHVVPTPGRVPVTTVEIIEHHGTRTTQMTGPWSVEVIGH